MEYKLLNEAPEKTYAIVFAEGDEFSEGILKFAEEQSLTAAHFTALGAFEYAQLGWFNLDKKDYETHDVREQVEVVSLVGNVADFDGNPKVHAHVVLAKRDMSALGGHLMVGRVRPTLEVTLRESPRHLHRRHDPRTGLALIRPGQVDLPTHRRAETGVH